MDGDQGPHSPPHQHDRTLLRGVVQAKIANLERKNIGFSRFHIGLATPSRANLGVQCTSTRTRTFARIALIMFSRLCCAAAAAAWTPPPPPEEEEWTPAEMGMIFPKAES